jgi:signal transduction histidine kinase
MSAPPTLADTSTAPGRASVWVVDDSPVERENCRRVLSAAYDVRVFAGGSEMLEVLSRERAPQLLVLDWHMPEVSGVEACVFIREKWDIAQLPILILTAASSADSLIQALAAGANDFVRKPFSEAEMNARVSALVNLASLHSRLVETERRLRLEAEFRERFMGMLAHDLRQPLSAIQMASQALSRTESLPDPGAAFVALQLRAGARMQRMISELLDFTRSRPESGMPIQRQRVDFERIVRASLEEIRIADPETVLDFQVEGSCDGDWDADRLAQICSNLLGNAIEHAPRRSTIAVRLVGTDSGTDSRVELSVENQGPAIAEELRVTLFQPFSRGFGLKPRSGGVGLGLHIVDQIVRAHGGSISVESENEMTRFVVRLPREATDRVPDGPLSRG